MGRFANLATALAPALAGHRVAPVQPDAGRPESAGLPRLEVGRGRRAA